MRDQAITVLAVGLALAAAAPAAADRFVAPSGSDQNPCTRARPCVSFDHAYRQARAGATVWIAGGSYPAQTIRSDPGKVSSADVSFRPRPRARVSIRGDLTIDGADHLVIRGPMRIHGELFAAANAYSVDVSAARLRAHRFVLQAVRNWRIKGGSYGDFNGVDDPGTGDNYGNNKIEEYGGLYPANVIVNKVRIHDLFCVPSNCHAEGLFLWRTRNVTIRNSKFYNNDFYDIFFAGGDDSGTVIENNWFDDPYIPDTDGSTRHPSYGRGTAIQWKFDSASNYSNMLVRFNSFNRQTGLSSGSGSFTRAVGNLMGATDCASADYEYNIFTPASGAQKCGTHAMAVLRFPYMNGGHGPGLNYHIKGGKPVNFVPGWLSGSRIGRDIDGQRRPRGSARDAGSDELK